MIATPFDLDYLKSNEKENQITIKIQEQDYFRICQAYTLAVTLLAQQYPKPKAGRESDWKKEKREINSKMAQDLNESHRRFLKAGREWKNEKL
jgi:hypothetical protein|tara:strand:+ start:272 stop:550 length:279 start_codon:yes stop_codon:yes gene_type:complete